MQGISASRKKWLVPIGVVGLLFVAAVTYSALNPKSSPETKTPTTSSTNPRSLQIGDLTFQIEIADTSELISRGLSGRSSLAEGAGLLFIFDHTFQPGFWMKEMNFPIDIIWIGEDLKIVDMTRQVEPSTYPDSFHSSRPIRYVLELNAGAAEKYRFKVGDQVTF